MFLIHLFTSYGFAQTLDISITRGTDLDFTFNTIRHYTNGIIKPSATEFRIDSSEQWDLYVGAQTVTPGQWDLLSAYSSAGNSNVPVSILEIRAVSLGGTSQQPSFFELQDLSNPVYLIGSGANDPEITTGVGTNTAGDGVSDPFSHRFRIDYRLTPGVNFRPGVYSMTIVFTLAEDL